MLASGIFMSPAIACHVMCYFQPAAASTTHEQQILEALEQSLSYKTMGNHLIIRVNMVRACIRTVYGKLQINPKAELLGCNRHA